MHLYTILPKVIHVAEKLFDKHDPEILQQLDIQLNLASTCQQNKTYNNDIYLLMV